MKEKTLIEKLKQLFEIEYLDSMADVQGNVHVLFKEAVLKLKKLNFGKRRFRIINDIDKILGEFK